jgi:hypothetical protein
VLTHECSIPPLISGGRRCGPQGGWFDDDDDEAVDEDDDDDDDDTDDNSTAHTATTTEPVTTVDPSLTSSESAASRDAVDNVIIGVSVTLAVALTVVAVGVLARTRTSNPPKQPDVLVVDDTHASREPLSNPLYTQQQGGPPVLGLGTGTGGLRANFGSETASHPSTSTPSDTKVLDI